MNIQDYMTEVLTSQRDDWNVIPFGPSYRDGLKAAEGNIEVQSHHKTAALMKDLALTMAWGMPDIIGYSEPWLDGKFPSSKHASRFVDFFCCGALIHRETYLTLDVKGLIPLPSAKGLRAPKKFVEFCRLLGALDGIVSHELYADLRHLGVDITEEEWPFTPR